MPKDFARTDRIGEQMQRELSKIIQREIKDPRVGIVTISEVQVTRDLSYAKVYASVLADSDEEIEEAIEALNHAASFLRYQLAQVIKLRKMPELIFVFDKSILHGSKLASLIDKAIEEDQKKHQEDE